MKHVYFFGDGKADGKYSDSELLGGKGANLAEMTNIGLPVPPGFTIATNVCNSFLKEKKINQLIITKIEKAIQTLDNAKQQYTWKSLDEPFFK